MNAFRWSLLALVAVNVIYGLNYVISKDVMPNYMQPEELILLRVTGASLFFLLLAPFFPKDKIQRKHWPRLILCGLFGVCINQLLFFIGLNMGSPIHASVIMTSNPILVLLAAFVSGQEKPNFLKGLGIVMGGTGALLLILHGVAPESGGDNLMLANLLVLLNSISYSIYIVISKSLMQTYSPLTVVRWVFIFGWLMVLPFGAQQLLNTDFGSMPTYILWDLFFIVFAVTGITYLLNTIALKYVNPSLVSFFVYLQPLVACIHAIRAGKDQLSLTLCIGATLIFTGVFLVSRKKDKKSQEISERKGEP